MGAFFRANYGYQGKYLAEFSCRYDGSSKFPENSKWGFFPSASIGWRLSEEKFMEWSRNWLDNLKIRLSAGSMGNGNIDPYKYIDYMTIKTSTVVIGDALGSYTTAPGAIPLSLTWETATTYDVGFDMDLFRNRLSIGFDWYRRYTTDMYTVGVSLPSVYGTDAPKGNNASLKTNGWELSVGWRDSFELGGKAFSYNVKAMVWDARTWVTEYINPTGALGDYYEGKELGEIWGYRVEGLFRDQPQSYQESVLPAGIARYGMTSGLPVTLQGLVGEKGFIHGHDMFGFSAPYTVLDKEFGYNGETVAAEVKKLLGRA